MIGPFFFTSLCSPILLLQSECTNCALRDDYTALEGKCAPPPLAVLTSSITIRGQHLDDSPSGIPFNVDDDFTLQLQARLPAHGRVVLLQPAQDEHSPWQVRDEGQTSQFLGTAMAQ